MLRGVISHYRLIRQLGAGGMGEVYLAEDTRLDRQVALKVLPAEFAEDAQRRQRFLSEAKAASALNHPNVCVVYEVDETDDHRPFIAMEYIQGEMLDVWIRRGPMTIAKVVAVGVQVADAMEAAHERGVVHRDIKPSNISLNERGMVKVLDFGLAKRTSGTGLSDPEAGTLLATRSGQMVGTPSYMSPEQALGREVDARTDLFSLGVVLYECLAGRLPFQGDSLGDVLDKILHAQPEALARFNYQIPPDMERLVRKCLEKIPDRRYQSARELRVDLGNLYRDMEGGGDTTHWVTHRGGEAPPADTSSLAASVPQTPTHAAGMEGAPDPELIRRSDIYINGAQLDDQPMEAGKPGWLTEFSRHLALRLEQLRGEKVSVYTCPKPPGEAPVGEPVLASLPEAKTMISVLSPPFIRSGACRQEMETFWSVAERDGTLRLGPRTRLFKVLKTPVPERDFPSPWRHYLPSLPGFDFFEEDSVTGRIREFQESFGGESRHRYFERVYDLAWEVNQLLKDWGSASSTDRRAAPRTSGRTVFLAATSSDLRGERDRIRRELQERGHTVLPDAEVPLQADALETVVRAALRQSSVCVHLLGQHYGVIPEDASESVPAYQLRLSAEHAREGALDRLIWIPRAIQPADGRQSAFLDQVREDTDLQGAAEVIEGPLTVLTRELLRRMEPAAETDPTPPANEGSPRVYLICDPRDESSVEPLEDYLYSAGLEVSLPAMDGDDAQAQELHRQNLLSCDAVLVYFGQAPRAWVEIKLRDILKAGGLGRSSPIRCQGVYVAPPMDRRKERFRSHHVEVIRGETAFSSGPLEAFVRNVKATRS